MKVRKIKYSLFASMMAVVAVFLASCEDTLEIGSFPMSRSMKIFMPRMVICRDAKV